MRSVHVAPRPADEPRAVAWPVSDRLAKARIDICEDFATAVPAWDRLIELGAIVGPFGGRDWIELWHRHIGAPAGFRPLIAIARDEQDEPLFLLPFTSRPGGRLTIARYFGGRHAQLNMGLWRRDVAATVTVDDLNAVLAAIAQRAGIDLFLLLGQPALWDGRPNPMAQLPHQASPDDVFRLDIDGAPGEQLIKTKLNPALRGTLKSKEKKLAQLAGYRYFRAASAPEAERVLAAFLTQKAAHLEAQGVRNAFAEPGAHAFLRAACVDALASGEPVIELHAIEGGGEILAVLGGTATPQRFSSMFNSYTLTEHARWSPGLILISHIIRDCADRGIASYDLGAGYAQYKRFFCKTVDPLFDTVLAFSGRGRIAAAALRIGLACKRRIKSTGLVWAIVCRLRRLAS